MELQLILFLLMGLIVGTFTGFFIIKLMQQKDFVKRSNFDVLQAENTDLKLGNVSRISPEALRLSYVTKDLFDSLTVNFTNLKDEFRKEKEENL
jgi:hypothetical protein